MTQIDVQALLAHPVHAIVDENERASASEAIATEEALAMHLARAKAEHVEPTLSGLCACGCGEEVDPRRLKLGYGLTVECAEARARNRFSR